VANRSHIPNSKPRLQPQSKRRGHKNLHFYKHLWKQKITGIPQKPKSTATKSECNN
jgi:hypothetical protein